jgi:predicted LPLAT superfamily acyltransferase
MRAPRTAQLLEGERKPAAWVAHRERGNWTLLRAMAFVSVHCGRRASRPIVYGIALYFFLFAPTARRASRKYLNLALGRRATMADRFRQILSFASTIHDRVYLVNGRFELFDITISGQDLVEEQLTRGRGALLLGAHIGSFEVLHSLARLRTEVEVAMAMYEDNARKISAILAAINPSFEADIIRLGHLDAMLHIAERLEHGTFVGVLGDRTLGGESTQTVTVLGQRAELPQGPMRAAAILRCPVIFMAGLYRGANRYHLVFEKVADFSDSEAGTRSEAVHDAIARYAAMLDKYCRSDPYNWFNFFDFWHAPR